MCWLCAADVPRDVAFGCEQDRRGTLWLRPYPHGRRTAVLLAQWQAAAVARPHVR